MNENPYSHMDQEAYRVAYLIAGFIRHTLTEREHDELNDWVNASDRNMLLFEELTDEKNLEANLAWMDSVQTEQSFQALQESGAFEKEAKRFHLPASWMAAASLIMLVVIFLIYQVARKHHTDAVPLARTDTAMLQPGGNKATLTLADGSVIDLTHAENGLIANDNASHVNKPAAGELVYAANDSLSQTPSIHTLSTPVGGQYTVTLPDGTKVWLNASTSLKYPTQFPLGARKVEVDGEAYFEVVKNKRAPFTVLLPDSTTVTVLGTHFNVMTYRDEGAKEVTLLEGSVAVKKGKHSEELQPGMQARILMGGLTKIADVDTEAITGWKNNLFVFHDAPIQNLMRQVARWYDVRLVYNANKPENFNATISRSEPLPKLLHLLELTGKVHFKTQNKTIYVLP